MARIIFFIALLAPIIPAAGQISTDEAYQRLRQRQAIASTQATAKPPTTQSAKPITMNEAIREAARELNQTLNVKISRSLTEVQADELRQKIKDEQASIVKTLSGKTYPMRFTVGDVVDAKKHEGGIDGLPFISASAFELPQPPAQEAAWNDYLRSLRRYASQGTEMERPSREHRLQLAESHKPAPLGYIIVSGSSDMKSWRRLEVKNLVLVIDHIDYKTRKDWIGEEDGDRSWNYVSEIDVFTERESDYLDSKSRRK